MASRAAPARWRTVTWSLTLMRLEKWVARWSRWVRSPREKSPSSRMFTTFTIQGVAVFRLSRKISDTVSSSRARGASSSPADTSRTATSRSSARVRLSPQRRPRRVLRITSWAERHRRSRSSSSAAATRTSRSSRFERVTAKSSSS